MNNNHLNGGENGQELHSLNDVLENCNIEIDRIKRYQSRILSNDKLNNKEKLNELEISRNLEKIILEIAEGIQTNQYSDPFSTLKTTRNIFDPKTWNTPLTYIEKLQYQIRRNQLIIAFLIFLVILFCFTFIMVIFGDR